LRKKHSLNIPRFFSLYIDKLVVVGIIAYEVNLIYDGVNVLAGSPKFCGRRKRWNIVESVFFVLLILVSGYILLKSPVFEVRKVMVRGNHFLNEDLVRSVADISPGINIFKADLEGVASNLKKVPMIRESSISRSLPSTVIIEIIERVPLGLLLTNDGLIEVDEEGVYLTKGGAGTPGLPIITGVQGDMAGAGPGQVVRAERLGEALIIISELPRDVTSNLSEVNLDKDGQVKLYTVEGIQCRFGLASEVREKGAILSQIITELRKQGARVNYIDLSCADQPVIYYKKQ